MEECSLWKNSFYWGMLGRMGFGEREFFKIWGVCVFENIIFINNIKK